MTRRIYSSLNWELHRVFSTIASIIAAPDVVARVKETLGIITLVEKKVGRFAGAYTVIADGVVADQRRYKWKKGSLDFNAYRKTFWEPSASKLQN